MTTRCATPGCHKHARYGTFRLFCRSCAENLARIRDELEAAARNKCRSVGNNGRVKPLRPRCCTPGCEESRRAHETYCAVCRAMGAVEDEAA